MHVQDVQHSKRKGEGLVNIVQHFCTSEEFRQQNLIGRCGNYLTWTGFPYHKPLNHHTFTDLLTTPPICWNPANNIQGLVAESIATASPWCKAVLYSPDPLSFLEEGLHGYERVRVVLAPRATASWARTYSYTDKYYEIAIDKISHNSAVSQYWIWIFMRHSPVHQPKFHGHVCVWN